MLVCHNEGLVEEFQHSVGVGVDQRVDDVTEQASGRNILVASDETYHHILGLENLFFKSEMNCSLSDSVVAENWSGNRQKCDMLRKRITSVLSYECFDAVANVCQNFDVRRVAVHN
jgi:hypothetical protein